MNHFELRAYTGNLIQFTPEKDVFFCTGTVKQGELEVLNPVTDCPGQRQERRNPGAAGKTDDQLFIPQIFVIEEALRCGSDDRVADFLFTEQPVSHKTAGI